MNNRIRELRKQNGITMKQLGSILGLAESTISQYETGKREPDIKTLTMLADYFGVTVDYLLGNADNPSILRPAHHTDISVVDIDKPDVLSDIDVAFYGDFNELSEDDQETIRAMVRLMRERREAKKKPPQD